MEISEEEDTMMYIHFSKKQIDDYILKNEYQLAFHSLISVLGRLDNDCKKDFIDYYSKKTTRFNMSIANNQQLK
jgi:hypothetical protein